MNENQIREKVLNLLGEIAPEIELGNIDPKVNFREQIDINSMDYLNFVIALDEEFDVRIPESEYTKFTSLEFCVRELMRLGNNS
jgi:acyl carrier protein